MKPMIPTALLAACVAVLLTACGGPRTVSIPVRGLAPLNPNDARESTPVDVRVWPLGGADRFKAATVDQLWTDPKTALGSDLIGEAFSFTVFPGAPGDPPVEQNVEMPESTRFVGVLAMYQRSDAQDQRATVLSVKDIEKYGLQLTGFSVSIFASATAAAPAAPAAPAAK